MKKTVFIYSVLFIVSIAISYFGVIDLQKISTIFKREHQYIPTYSKTHKQEINLIYVGSSSCKFCKNKALYKSVDKAKSLMYEKSMKLGVGFSAIGIAINLDPKRGFEHLQKYGYFNEVITGNNWNNNGTIKYMGKMSFETSTPQIILTFRTYTEYIHTKVENEKEIVNYAGLKNILNWVQEGAPLPKKFIKEIE